MGTAVALNPNRDALEMLRAEHRTIDRLLEDYEHLRPLDEERASAAATIGRELTYHTMLEDEVLLPVLDGVAGSPETCMAIEVARLEIQLANALIERAESLYDDVVRLDAVFQVLIPLVRRHLGTEEQILFPVLGKSGVDMGAMAARIASYRAEVDRAVVGADIARDDEAGDDGCGDGDNDADVCTDRHTDMSAESHLNGHRDVHTDACSDTRRARGN